MTGFLFQDVIFGPVRSRRLGLSLGVNLLPLHYKYCSFNCIYCECGWTKKHDEPGNELPSRETVALYLEKRLTAMSGEGLLPDAITFAGNGEPTMHPDFSAIIDDTIRLRDLLAPGALVSVLTNSFMIGDPQIFNSLAKIDRNICKLDAGSERIFQLLNNPAAGNRLSNVVENLSKFQGKVIIQSMFLRGRFKNEVIDNTVGEEVSLWIDHLRIIRPSMVMIYPIARETPVHSLEIIPASELEVIAERVRECGIVAQVYQ